MRAFNEAWFRRAPRTASGELSRSSTYFHPLDWVTDWNLLYGPERRRAVPVRRPRRRATRRCAHAIELLGSSGVPSFLGVLKRFGPADPGPLSFPIQGWTLALDVPVGPPQLPSVLDALDELVVDAGGRVYLAKDARLDPARLAAMYPRLDELAAVRARLDPHGVLALGPRPPARDRLRRSSRAGRLRTPTATRRPRRDLGHRARHRGAAVPERVRTVVLAGRSASLLAAAADELRAAGATEVETVRFDAREPTSAPDTVAACLEAAGGPVDLVVVAVGALGDQERDEDDAARALEVVEGQLRWPVAALAALRGRLVAQGTGRILVVSSVAGVRVRRVNYLYGGAKAGLDATCIGMAESLRGTGVALQVLRPGFVRSKMTEGRDEAPFTTDVDAVADVAVAGLSTEATVLWSPPRCATSSARSRCSPSPCGAACRADRAYGETVYS